MLSAGLLYGRNGGRGGEGWDRGERALSLDFFLRLVRALGRHLAPISVPSPLVRYLSALEGNMRACLHCCMQPLSNRLLEYIIVCCFCECGTHFFSLVLGYLLPHLSTTRVFDTTVVVLQLSRSTATARAWCKPAPKPRHAPYRG